VLHIEKRGHVLVPLSEDDPAPAGCVLSCVERSTGDLGDCLERCPNNMTAEGECPPTDGSARFVCARRDGELTERVSESCDAAAMRPRRPGDVLVGCEEGGRRAVITMARGLAIGVAVVLGAIFVIGGLWLVAECGRCCVQPCHGEG
jgi:hypothetical protein